MPLLRAAASALAVSLLLVTAAAQGETSASRLARALEALPDGGERALRGWSGSSTPSLLVHSTDDAESGQRGFVPIVPGLLVGEMPPQQWASLRGGAGRSRWFVPTRRELLLDRVGETVALGSAHHDSGLRGEGTIVGVVDTGGDVFHPALRDDDGRTRVAWFLVFDEEPAGLHPELEEAYGCHFADPCAVFGREDIDAALELGRRGSLPDDPIGHGTHIASLAAGNDAEYPGIAPSADLILVGAAGREGGATDARILLGTKFIFDRARDVARPAVVNVSLGSSFGAHDGTSSIERGLAMLARGEGRAIVLAAGNGGQVHEGVSRRYPGPFGVHTEVAVLRSSQVRVPLLTPDHPSGTQTGTVFVWISTRPGDSISLGFSNGQGGETRQLAPGEALAYHSDSLDDGDGYDVILLNGVDEEQDSDVFPEHLVLAVVGTWQAGRVFEVVLEGHGNARMWVAGSGTLSPNVSRFGPLFPRARRAGTVAVPASHPDLITVGATINRNEWEDFSGELVGYGGRRSGAADFSAAGPNQGRVLKPELAAPGAGVIGALASAADPRTSSEPSQFSAHGSCPDERECFVIDDEHGIATGTSMAAPLVAGAVALLMQRDNSLTMEQAKRYLMAGAHGLRQRTTPSLVGTGELDVVGALVAQERHLSEEPIPMRPDASRSRVVWADDFLYPGTGPALEGYLLVRDADGQPLGVSDSDVDVTATGPARVTFERLGPGLVRLVLDGDEDGTSESATIRVALDGQVVAEDTFVIERDPILAEHGYEISGGTCSAVGWSPARSHRSWPTSAWVLVVLLSACLSRPLVRR